MSGEAASGTRDLNEGIGELLKRAPEGAQAVNEATKAAERTKRPTAPQWVEPGPAEDFEPWQNPEDPLEGIEDRVRARGIEEACEPAALDAALDLEEHNPRALSALRERLCKACGGRRSETRRWDSALRTRRKERADEGKRDAALRARSELREQRERLAGGDNKFFGVAGDYLFNERGVERVVRDPRTGDVATELLIDFIPLIEAQSLHHEFGLDTRTYRLSIRTSRGRVLPAAVDALEFEQPAWIPRTLGTEGRVSPIVLYAWKFAVDAVKLRCADAPVHRTYGQSGWHYLPGRGWVYLDCGGGIGADGHRDDVRTVLQRESSPQEEGAIPRGQPRMHAYALPPPLEGPALVPGVRALLALLTLEWQTVWVPAVAHALRAVLGPSRAQLHVYGNTKVGKSEFVALVQRLFGTRFANGALPASWSDSAANLITRRNILGDTLLAIDDAAPADRTATDKQLVTISMIFRSGFNQEAVGRNDRGGRARAEQLPRCAVLSSGEFRASQTPSIANRILELPFPERLPFDPRTLVAGAEARAGALAAYVRWLAPRIGELRANGNAKLRDLDARAAAHYRDLDSRLAEVIGPLHAGLEMFFAFARELGALDDATARGAFAALEEVARRQLESHEGTDAGTVALEALRGAVYAGRAHIEGADRGAPSKPYNAGDFGYRIDSSGGWKPLGDKIGALHPRLPGVVCLKRESAYTRLVAELRAGNRPELFRDNESLGRALFAAGLLAETEHKNGKGEYSARVSMNNRRERWLVVRWGDAPEAAASEPASNEVADSCDSEVDA